MKTSRIFVLTWSRYKLANFIQKKWPVLWKKKKKKKKKNNRIWTNNYILKILPIACFSLKIILSYISFPKISSNTAIRTSGQISTIIIVFYRN